MILATDMAHHFDLLAQFRSKVLHDRGDAEVTLENDGESTRLFLEQSRLYPTSHRQHAKIAARI